LLLLNKPGSITRKPPGQIYAIRTFSNNCFKLIYKSVSSIHHYFKLLVLLIVHFGSNYESNITEFEARHYYPLNALDNFNSKLFAGYAHDTPFSHPFDEIGSVDTIRGLADESFSGNVLFFANLGYAKGLAKYPGFRGSLFLDIGKVYDGLNAVDFSDLRTSIGFGVRWMMVAFVKTDLFIDIAYDTETGESKTYGGTSLCF